MLVMLAYSIYLTGIVTLFNSIDFQLLNSQEIWSSNGSNQASKLKPWIKQELKLNYKYFFRPPFPKAVFFIFNLKL